MKPLKTMMLGISVAGIMAGCSSNDVPKCDDSDAKELVLDIAMTELKNQIARETGYASYKQLRQILKEAEKSDDPKTKKAKEDFESLIKFVDERAESASMSLDSIRTDNIDNALKKRECSAVLNVNDSQFSIKYRLEITSDDKLFATVYGL